MRISHTTVVCGTATLSDCATRNLANGLQGESGSHVLSSSFLHLETAPSS
jgi:hypothetical protein